MHRLIPGILAATLTGCAGAGAAPATAPEPAASPEAAWDALLPADDSAADRAALDALDTLTFSSLDRRADHVRGAVATPLLEENRIDAERDRLFHPPRGGAASASGPTYDIDVASFASHRRVQYYVDYFLGPARGRFAIWLNRLHRYEGMIRQTLRVHGVPEDMVYLALIESGYSNTAVSRAAAVGMWQFIQRTGRQYGLRVDTWLDERRDPFKATEAAARHLADLNEQFGSWYLAAAAYNGGAGRVSRGIRRLRGSDDVSDTTFFHLSDRRYLRRETRDYVPKLIAAAIIAKDPARYGFEAGTPHLPLVYDEIVVTDATSLDVLAGLADTTARALVELNPQFYRGVTPPGRTVTVRVPRGAGGAVARAWADLPADERVSFVEHRIRRGETLAIIGTRYGVSVPLLMSANPGIQPRRLRVGARLVIPISDAARQRAASGRVVAPGATGATWHTVRRGESLWIISQRYGVRISDLRRWNRIRGEVLSVGQRLRVAPSSADLR